MQWLFPKLHLESEVLNFFNSVLLLAHLHAAIASNRSVEQAGQNVPARRWVVQSGRLGRRSQGLTDSGYMSRKKRSLERINSMRKTNASFDSSNSGERLDPAVSISEHDWGLEC